MSTRPLVVPRTPGGFPELLPADQIAFNRMLARIRQTYETFGFTPIETPAIELNDILFAKGGGETEKQIYRVGDDMSLHFDLTVPLARYAAEHASNLVFPFRRYQIQKVWRAEKRQVGAGRYNEFYQCDVDVIGSEDPMCDAEMPAIIWATFSALELPGITIRMSNRKLLNGILESIGITSDSEPCQTDVLRMIDKIDKVGEDTVHFQLEDMGVSVASLTILDNFFEIAGSNSDILSGLSCLDVNETFDTGLNELSQVFECIGLFGVPDNICVIDLSTARGLDYYTGTVYETTLASIPDVGSVCSGGRFDNLVGCYSDISMPGVGVSIGATRLFMKLNERGFITDNGQAVPSKLMIAHRGGRCLEKAIELATELRSHGIPVEVYLPTIKLDKQFRYADRNGIGHVVVVGEDEVASGEFAIKSLADKRQITRTQAQIVEMFKAEASRM